MKFTPEQRDQMCRLAGVQPTVSDATLFDALHEAIDEARDHYAEQRAAPAVAAHASSASGESDIVAWGYRTGRYSAERARFWASASAEEKRRTGGTAPQTEATIRALHPVYAPAPDDVKHGGRRGSPWVDDGEGHMVLASALGVPSDGLSDTPRLDELDEQVFGPSIEERHRREDLAAEAALRDEIEREREEAAAGHLTADEERALFGDTGRE